jgi:hypothetical protein
MVKVNPEKDYSSIEISLLTVTVVSSLNLILKFNFLKTEIIGLLSFVVSAASFLIPRDLAISKQ